MGQHVAEEASVKMERHDRVECRDHIDKSCRWLAVILYWLISRSAEDVPLFTLSRRRQYQAVPELL